MAHACRKRRFCFTTGVLIWLLKAIQAVFVSEIHVFNEKAYIFCYNHCHLAAKRMLLATISCLLGRVVYAFSYDSTAFSPGYPTFQLCLPTF